MPRPPRLGHNSLTGDTLETRAALSGRLWEARQRARDEVTEAFETIDDPDEVPIRRRGEGFGPAREFLEFAEPREAAHRLDPEFPRQDLGPDDVVPAEDGFRPTEATRRRSAAYEFEETTALDDVDPFGGLVAQEDGFGLAADPQRRLAARELDPQFPEVDLGPDDVAQTDEGYGLTPTAEREVAAERIEDQTPLNQVAPGDVTRTEEGFELREAVLEENAGLFR